MERLGSNVAVAKELGVSEWTIRSWRKGAGAAKRAPLNQTRAERESCTVTDDQVVVVLPPAEQIKLGDIEPFLREHGLDPAEWVVVSTTINKWNAMTGAQRDNEIVWMRQLKVTLRPAAHVIFPQPAVHVPRVRPRNSAYRSRVEPQLVVIEGDHQVPYHDPALHEASLTALETIVDRYDVRKHVFLGDTGDYPTTSRHPDHPAAMASTQEVVQGSAELLRDKREATGSQVEAFKLEGNHDWRLKQELLLRAERMFGIKPAQLGDEPEEPALSLNRLLHLPKLGITLVEDPRGWQHAEVELIPDSLVVRHGWITGHNTAGRSIAKRGRSLIVGHTHSREHVYVWDPSAGVERQGVVIGTMSMARGGPASMAGVPNYRFPHFAVCDDWLQGFGIATLWPDGQFNIEHALWDGNSLRWRDWRWHA